MASQDLTEWANSDLSLLGDAFTARRVSPLLFLPRRGTESFEAVLNVKARHLHEALDAMELGGSFQSKSDFLLQSSFNSGLPSKNKGRLTKVAFYWMSVGHFLGPNPGDESSFIEEEIQRPHFLNTADSPPQPSARDSLCISIDYEKANYMAVLLPNLAPDSTVATHKPDSSPPQYLVHLPLMLMRMPAQLQRVVCSFLEKSFDCKVSSLSICSRTMLGIWENWVRTAPIPASKDVAIRFTFDIGKEDEEGQRIPLGINSLDIKIAANDVETFTENATNDDIDALADMMPLKSLHGPLMEGLVPPSPVFQDAAPAYSTDWLGLDSPNNSRKPKNTTTTEYNNPNNNNQLRHSFFVAVGRHLFDHLAINVFHKDIHISRISCSAFSLTERTIKILPSAAEAMSPGVWGLIETLLERAQQTEFYSDFNIVAQ